jgi:hypothetical protein
VATHGRGSWASRLGGLLHYCARGAITGASPGGHSAQIWSIKAITGSAGTVHPSARTPPDPIRRRPH